MHVKKVDNGNGAVSLCKHLLPVSGYHIAACYSNNSYGPVACSYIAKFSLHSFLIVYFQIMPLQNLLMLALGP